MDIFGTLIARPFGWVFWAILQIINNYGVALILFSLIVKVILYPLQYKGKKGMLAQQRLQPKIKDIEARYKNDRTAYNAALQELYSQNGISPMSGCLPMLLTFPIMIGLYRVIRQPLSYVFGVSKDALTALINELSAGSAEAAAALAGMADGTTAINEITMMKYLPKTSEYFIDMNFLGLDLTQTPKLGFEWLVILPILSGATALLMSILSQKMQTKTLGGSQTTDQNRSAKMLLYTMPLISVVIGFTLPAGLTVYWIANNVLGIAQEYLLQLQKRRIMTKNEAKETAEDAAARAAREEARDRNREVQKAIATGGKKTQQKTAKKYKLSRSRRTSSDDGEDDD